MSKTITIDKDGIDTFTLITSLILEAGLTKRESSILKIIVQMKCTKLTDQSRKEITSKLGITRENLNNVLIRMQLKKVFDAEWNVSGKLLVLMKHDQVERVIINL